MDVLEKIGQLVEDLDNVYEAGYERGKAEGGYNQGFEAGKEEMHTAMMNAIISTNKTSFNYAFAGHEWNDELFKPTKVIKPTSFANAFQHNDVEYGAYTDLLDFSNCSSLNCAFQYSKVRKLKVIDTRYTSAGANGLENAFYMCSQLESIDEFYPPNRETNRASFKRGTFLYCTALTHIIFKSEIRDEGLYLADCPLDKESLMSVINNLKDFTGTGATMTVTLGTANLAKLTGEEKAIATEKGWNLA